MQVHRNALWLILGICLANVTVAERIACSEVSASTEFVFAQVQSPASPQAAPQAPARPRRPDVMYVPTPNMVVEEMLKVANVGKDDVVYDLGSGDGRIVITAAQKLGARGVGIDIDPQRVQEANQNAQQAGVSDRVQFLQQDLFETDLSQASVVTLYLLPSLNLKLRPKLLRELKPGTRIVSHNFSMGDWKPDQVVDVWVPGRSHKVYLWVVPEQVPPELLRSPQ